VASPADSQGMIAPTRATCLAATLVGLVVLASLTLLLIAYPSLPGLLPVHFKSSGVPNGWQYKTWARVLMPVFVQFALTAVFGAIGLLLLSRPHAGRDVEAPDVRAAATAVEAIALVALVWVTFQAVAAFALVRMWRSGRAGLGPFYTAAELVGMVLTAIVAWRLRAGLGRPKVPPFVAGHWRFGQLYRNPDDPALFVPTRDGRHWTLNFGRPGAAILLALLLTLGILGPVVMLGLALRG
jgi:uncharacterized membrane protein